MTRVIIMRRDIIIIIIIIPFATWEGLGPSHVANVFVRATWPGLAWPGHPDESICGMEGPDPLPRRKCFRQGDMIRSGLAKSP